MDGLESALRGGLDPEVDAERLFSPTPHGEFLLMPAVAEATMGIKVLTVSPGNPERGLEKIQGSYLLFDAETSAPLAVLDGLELTAVRTPAVTLTALRSLAAAAPEGDALPAAPEVLVFGAGIQALNHLLALAWCWPGARFGVVGRRAERVAALIAGAAQAGVGVSDRGTDVERAVRGAHVIVTLTTATTPLFDGGWVRPGAIVAAVGQHGLHAREVDHALVLRSDVLVEGRGSALREAGDLIPARSAEEWVRLAPPNLADAALDRLRRRPGAPALYCGVGMSWEDLVLASLVHGSAGTAAA
ncbi:ornithine cyclodeaminase family protein [Galactobacter valiniphilus]|uniref:ornithine cyclodeaminase family protein n=1 Tax=Galactobacter valiniphilus TaxID=2676122 RepID=UPI001F32D78A|nr:ornithine cyclodeaminase family protein [Galactobacter valiniphilus]